MTGKPSDDARIAALRQRCLQRKTLAWRQDPILSARSLLRSRGLPRVLRRGALTRDRLAGARLALDDYELLLGRPAPQAASTRNEQVEDAREFVAREFKFPGGQTGHCELDLSRVFAIGIGGLRRELRARMRTAGVRKRDVLQSFIYALQGLAALARRAAKLAEENSSTAPAWRRKELKEMAGCCRRIAASAPNSFRDALQLMWLVILGTQMAGEAGLVSPGHLDRSLRPFYERDLRRRRLTRGDALLLIESLYLLINETVDDGLAVAVMAGGRDAAGRDVTNELSYLSLDALRRTKLVYPTVGLCWHNDTPRELTELAIELISRGYPTPAFFGDETIQRGLKELGVPAQEACHYINSTCVEITPVGASNVWVASPYFSTCAILLEEIAAQAKRSSAGSFPGFLERYQQRLAERITGAVDEMNDLRCQRQRYGGKPLQSVFTRDCIARARDIDAGGAVYNWVECSFVGLANLADSLHVIRREIFEERKLTWAKLHEILEADFNGFERERLRFRHSHPKYGNGCNAVDGLVAETVAFVQRECARHRMHPGAARFVPGAFCWVMHERLGRECGATPDGRRKGFPFADGCGPAQGCELKGPTAAILSTTSWDPAPLIGGAAFNMKFSSSLFRSRESVAALRDLVITFLRRGGFETQINVVDHAVLQKARANPEAYRDLVVRIGGYTDYFARLSPQMQDEVMMRTEYQGV